MSDVDCGQSSMPKRRAQAQAGFYAGCASELKQTMDPVSVLLAVNNPEVFLKLRRCKHADTVARWCNTRLGRLADNFHSWATILSGNRVNVDVWHVFLIYYILLVS